MIILLLLDTAAKKHETKSKAKTHICIYININNVIIENILRKYVRLCTGIFEMLLDGRRDHLLVHTRRTYGYVRTTRKRTKI